MAEVETVFDTFEHIAAVLTLPAGILAAIFLGLEAAGVVFVVGWLLLVPLFDLLGGRVAADTGTDEDAVHDEAAPAGSEEDDALTTLRERYATGEIDDIEFERRLEGLIATEGVEVPPEVETQVAVDSDADAGGSDRGDEPATDEPDPEYELERERE